MVLGRECPVQAWVHYQAIHDERQAALCALGELADLVAIPQFGKVWIINKWCKFGHPAVLTFYIKGAPMSAC